MPVIKTLLIEDENLARRELRTLLQAHPFVDIVGEAVSPKEALELIDSLNPSLIFLDVNLRGGMGFDFLQALPTPAPDIIFTTAPADFAVQAFDFNAVDYLLKPVEPARLALALQKIGRDSSHDKTHDLPLEADSRILIKEADSCFFVRLVEISLIESEGNSSRIHTGHASHLVHKSLSSVEARLPPRLFFRANRCQIINLGAINHLEPWFSNTLRATLDGDVVVEFSRRASLDFRESQGL